MQSQWLRNMHVIVLNIRLTVHNYIVERDTSTRIF